jgi:hypothetical protein
VKFIKTFSLAIVAAVAVMAFVGASSAMATTTALCTVNEASCAEANQVKSIHMVNVGVGTLLNSTADVLCLNILSEAEVLGLGAPQTIHTKVLKFETCGTNAAHNNCEVTVETLPLLSLLKTGANIGTLTAESGLTKVKCTILGFIKIDCVYDLSGTGFASEGGTASSNGLLKATKTPAKLAKENKGPCPTESTLDGTLEPLVKSFIVA